MKLIQTDRWCYGMTDESFSEDFPTKLDAIEACKEDLGGGYIGRIVEVEFEEKDIHYDDSAIYSLQEMLYWEIGDVAENWVLSSEQEIELSKIISKDIIDYINKNDLQPKCYKVVDIEEVFGEELC